METSCKTYFMSGEIKELKKKKKYVVVVCMFSWLVNKQTAYTVFDRCKKR